MILEIKRVSLQCVKLSERNWWQVHRNEDENLRSSQGYFA